MKIVREVIAEHLGNLVATLSPHVRRFARRARRRVRRYWFRGVVVAIGVADVFGIAVVIAKY